MGKNPCHGARKLRKPWRVAASDPSKARCALWPQRGRAAVSWGPPWMFLPALGAADCSCAAGGRGGSQGGGRPLGSLLAIRPHPWGRRSPLRDPPAQGKTISYSAERIIDNGSFGVVFQARVVETNEIVAIKKVLQDRRYKVRTRRPRRLRPHTARRAAFGPLLRPRGVAGLRPGPCPRSQRAPTHRPRPPSAEPRAVDNAAASPQQHRGPQTLLLFEGGETGRALPQPGS